MNDELTVIRGTIERVTYHNSENGFCVLKVHLRSSKHLGTVTVVANAPQVTAGEEIEAHGQWIHDKNYGQQFKATNLKLTHPNSLEGIEKYLASGLIKGVGKHFAKVLVGAFGGEIFTILDKSPNKILGLPGIGEKRLNLIIKAWNEQHTIREIMLFLHSHGMGTARAARIYKTYGDNTINKLKTNPYCLSLDIWGIGFKTADNLAMSLGIDKNSVIRAEAGIRHILNEFSTSGHCAILPETLIAQCKILLEIDEPVILEAISNELTNGNIVEDVIKDIRHLYIAPLYYAEQGIANNIKRLLQASITTCLSDNEILQLANQSSTISFSPSQIAAIIMAIHNKVSIITGGPGVGKTTIVRSILKIFKTLGGTVTLCAPTGRAAKRLTESSGIVAKTIHRLLEYKPGLGARYNGENPLKTDFVVIDETSMVDVSLMNTLLKAIPTHARILFVGDIDQLPSVGPGSVLTDLINSGTIPTTSLTEIFRQALSSKIITNAHRINVGNFPIYDNTPQDDFFFIELDDPDEIIARIISITNEKLPKLYQFNSLTDIQVLSPMNKGSLGIHNLNIVLQQYLNPDKSVTVHSMGVAYRVGDKVIQTVNNYDKDVFNGDIGFIESINLEEDIIMIRFDDRRIEYSRTELDELNLAYAISIHKSQGSEYPVVIIPVVTQHYTLLERNLLYTGVTRGKKMVILIGQKKALFMAVKRVSAHKRITSLDERLRS